jgi:competence protein ComEA
MRWRGRDGTVPGRAGALVEQRLAAFATQWRPTAPPPSDRSAWSADEGPPPGDGWAAVRADGGEPSPPRGGSWTRSALRGLALLVGCSLLVAGYWMWTGRPRAVAVAPVVLSTGAAPLVTPGPVPTAAAATTAAAAPTPVAEVVVHVAGQVARPGLVRLPAGSRVADAIQAAGGVTRPRAADTVNLARVLVDGEQVLVGVPGAAVPGAAVPGGVAAAAAPAVLDLNAASVTDLDSLPGVGPVLAARIVAWRAANGPFRSVDELGEVSGIGDAILAQVRSLVRV